MLQGKCLRIVSSESPAKLHCCYVVITVLTVAVVALSVALSVRTTEQISIKNTYENTYAACPSNWIGFGNKCFYFSEYTSNWTSSQTFCMEKGAQLARFDNQEELDFLMRYKGTFDYWIGLHRESPEQPWIWTDNTEYNNWVLTRKGGESAYLSDNEIRGGRDDTYRKWICNKPNNYTVRCPVVVEPG